MPVLSSVFKAILYPWKLVLRRKVRSVLAEAESNAAPGQVPAMRVTGSPSVRLIDTPTPTQVADFVRYRSPAYVGPMSDGVADSLARMVLGTDKPIPLGTQGMNELLMRTASAYLVERDGDWWSFDFTRRSMYPLRTITITRYRFHAETGAAEITDAWDRTYTEGDAMFETAMTHTMCWWNHYIHSGLHNWVHFHLPDCMVEAHASLADPDSVLARLIAPHVRFTARINYAGLWLNQSTDNGPGLLKRLKPWGAAQSKADDFQRGVIENTGKNYADLDGHFARPEALDLRVPYHAFIAPWYRVIEAFVARVDPHIEDDAWQALLEVLERGIPGVRAIPRVRLLAEFIWQVGVLHITDHLTYARRAFDHGFHWVPETLDKPFTTKNVRRFDRFKTRNFLNVFVDYNGVDGVSNGMLDTENYRFTEPELAAAASEFRAALEELDARLESEGKHLGVHVRDMRQSVCF